MKTLFTLLFAITFSEFANARPLVKCTGKRAFVSNKEFILLSVIENNKGTLAEVSIAETPKAQEFERQELFKTKLNLNGRTAFDQSPAWTGANHLEITFDREDLTVGWINFYLGGKEFHAYLLCK